MPDRARRVGIYRPRRLRTPGPPTCIRPTPPGAGPAPCGRWSAVGSSTRSVGTAPGIPTLYTHLYTHPVYHTPPDTAVPAHHRGAPHADGMHI